MRKESVKPGGKLNGRYGVYYDDKKVGAIIRTRRSGLWFPVVKGKADFGLFCNSREQAAANVIVLDAARDGLPCPECNGTKRFSSTTTSTVRRQTTTAASHARFVRGPSDIDQEVARWD